jgi:hypothetical protein
MVSLSSVRKPLSSAWLTLRFVGIGFAVHSTTEGFDDIAALGGLARAFAQASATREADFGPDDGTRDCLALLGAAAPVAGAASVPSSLVNTIETWRWAPRSPDPAGWFRMAWSFVRTHRSLFLNLQAELS